MRPDADHYAAMALERGGTVYGVDMDALAPPARPMSEKAFQSAVCQLADRNGWKWHHHTISQKSKDGWPDLVLLRHRCVVAELKVEPNKPTASQLTWLESFQAAGIDAHVWYPSDWSEIVRVLTESPCTKK